MLIRPWKTFGEGPHTVKSGAFAGGSTATLDSGDIRFTHNKRGDIVYAIILGWPAGDRFQIRSLGTASPLRPGVVANVEFLGCVEKLDWNQSAEFLTAEKPSAKPCDFAYTRKIRFA